MAAPIGNKHAVGRRTPVRSASENAWRAALNRALAQDDGKRLREGAERLLDLYAEGEQWAAQMLADRIDGKAIQSVDVRVDGVVEHVVLRATDLRTMIREHAAETIDATVAQEQAKLLIAK